MAQRTQAQGQWASTQVWVDELQTLLHDGFMGLEGKFKKNVEMPFGLFQRSKWF